MNTTRLAGARWLWLLMVAVIMPGWMLHVSSAAANQGGSVWNETKRGPATVIERGANGDETLAFLSYGDEAGEASGLHVSSEELAAWRERWDDPSATSDAFLEARIEEERQRVSHNRNSFVSDPSTWPMDPNVSKDSGGCYSAEPKMQPQRYQSARSRDAALYGLINADPDALEPVRSHLVAQAQRADLDFSQPPWCPLNDRMKQINIMFPVTHAMMTTLFAYDYYNVAVAEGIVADMTPSEHAMLREWFIDYAEFLMPSMDYFMGHAFVDRLNGDYTLSGSYTDPNFVWGNGHIYQGGPQNHRSHRLFTNPYFGSARYLANVGVMFDNSTFKDRAHRAGTDWVRYHLYPEGVTSDGHRGWSDAWGFHQYGTLGGTYAIIIADVLARDGDTRLYDYETTAGVHDSAGAPPSEYGGKKSLLFFVQSMARHGNNTFERYNGAGEQLNFRTGSTGNAGNHDRFILANMYYQDNGLSRDWYRGTNGQPQWVMPRNARGAKGGGTDLNGNWSFAAPYLQWAGLEGQVSPYPPK